MSAGIACSLSLGNKVLHEIFTNICNENKKNMKKINKQENLLINNIENVYNIISFKKMKMNFYVTLLSNTLLKQKMSLL